MSHDHLGDDLAARPTLRAFRPGSWFGVLGARASVLLPPAQRHRVAGLWELVDAGADFEEVLDTLVAGGLRELPAFVLWAHTDDGLRVLLRGDARVSAVAGGEPVVLEGSGGATWTERTLADVTTFTVVLDADAHADETGLVVAAGLVRLGSLQEPAEAKAASQQSRETVPDEAEPEPSPEPLPEPEPAEDSLLTEPIQTLPPEVAREILAPSDPFAPPPPQPPSSPAYQPPSPVFAPPPAAPPLPPAAPFSDPVDAPAAPAGPPIGDAGDADHDGMTRSGGWEPGQFVRQHPGLPGQPPPPSVVSRPVARLMISSGDTVEVDRVILVGRAPEARRFTSTEQPRLVTVPSPQQEISSTHLEIRPGSGADHGTAVVTDMGSTNGTVLVQPGLPPEDLRPGVAVQLIPGAVLDLGDSVTIQVTRP